MDEGFLLSFRYKGQLYDLETKFVRLGYIHQFHVHYKDRTLVVEFDEERNYRVMDASNSSIPIDKKFIEAMVSKLSSLH